MVQTLHNAGIVHRDIKPQNILLRSNGEWVLADFGIAWFDPDTYENLAKTKNSDRLANFEFSPPEQRRRDAYEKAAPNMDIFALGQTLYYCVTGQTIRGTKHSRFNQIAPQIAKFDQLIERMVSQNPAERFQSAQEVKEYLTQLGGDKEFARLVRLNNEQQRQVEEFDKRLRRGIPGANYYTQAKDSVQINRVLDSLAENVQSYNLWWIKGRRADLEIRHMQKLDQEIWLITPMP